MLGAKLIRRRFILNGLDNANSILGEPVFDTADWRVIGEYVHDEDGGRHQAFYAPKRDLNVRGVFIEEGERVQVEQSLKYSQAESQVLWKAAGLKEVAKWGATGEPYSEFVRLLVLCKIRYEKVPVPTSSKFTHPLLISSSC